MNIPHITNFNIKDAPNLEKIVLAVHGFASSKKSPNTAAASSELAKNNIGLLAFDLPSHGENKTQLRIETCLDAIRQAENYLRQFNKPICFFSSSFGAYLTLLYLIDNPNQYGEIILRSPAIDLHKTMLTILRYCNVNLTDFERDKKATVLEKQVDYEFFLQSKQYNVFENAHKIKETINIIYGTEDDVVDNNDIQKLGKVIPCNLYPIQGADHDFKRLGDLNQMVAQICDILFAKASKR